MLTWCDEIVLYPGGEINIVFIYITYKINQVKLYADIFTTRLIKVHSFNG